MFDKYFPKNFTLETPRVLLEPISTQSTPATEQNVLASEFYTSNNGSPQGLTDHSRIIFNITDLHAKIKCGTAGYNNISFDKKCTEISWSWSDPENTDQGLIKNLKFVMLSYGFQVMKMDKITMTGDGSMTIQKEEWQSVKETFFPELM